MVHDQAQTTAASHIEFCHYGPTTAALPLVNEQIGMWFKQHGIVFRQTMTAECHARGFNMQGTTAIIDLAKVIFRGRIQPVDAIVCWNRSAGVS
jgi:hypothetical protein